MKTNRFEENLRKKLESIEPDFEEKDWQQMQTYMRQQAPPSFWQTHGQWAGYALAGATALVTVVLYHQQSQQSDQLRQEIASLKKTLEQQQAAPPVVIEKTDTVYVLKSENKPVQPEATLFEEKRRELATLERESARRTQVSPNELPPPPGDLVREQPPGFSAESSAPAATTPAETEKAVLPGPVGPVPGSTQSAAPAPESTSGRPAPNTGSLAELVAGIPVAGIPVEGTSGAKVPTTPQAPVILPEYRTELAPVEFLRARPLSNRTSLGRKLATRMPKATVNRPLAVTPLPAPPSKVAAPPQPTESQKAERILPELPVPYRIGVGQQWEARAKATTLWADILLGRHLSVTTGLSWLKPQEERYFNEKVFREKKRQDFRAKHGRGIPPSFEVFNITTRTTLVQVPVGVTFRGELGRDFAYLLGAGTNLNVRTRQVLSFDLRIPTQQIDHWTKRILPPTPTFTNVQVSAGIEKRWNPIVLQADAYLISRDSPRSYLPDKQSLGVRFKILYQFGKVR
ncbi:hypothetical protein [Telluribacter sp.]|jgi:hypothetical protein|uniref:hypothetical protein n=1 Tax=Telluribacter sp. TaxID=1978767 RepID=UPI002E12AFB9|nr:hypothetical protein [Telluribacter sp.]